MTSERPQMQDYELQISSFSGQLLFSHRIRAEDADALLRQMQEVITDFHNQPDRFVSFDHAQGTYRIGAGMRSHKGRFTLTVPAPA